MIELEEDVNLSISSYDQTLLSLLSRYSLDGNPIEVSFRKIVCDLKSDRFTHLIHTYPAKLLMHIPHFFINNDIFSSKGDTILDPFSGSGTVMLEGILAGRNVIGADSNPLARLISSVKIRNYNLKELEKTADTLFEKIGSSKGTQPPFVVNVDYWFSQNIQLQLSDISHCINNIDSLAIREFYMVCFSNCVKKVSFADQRVSVPVKLNPNRYPSSHPLYGESKRKLEGLKNINVLNRFKEAVFDNIQRFKNLSEEISENKYSAKIVSDDARHLNSDFDGKGNKVSSNSVSLIITSPPYAGAQKYIRSSSLSLGWLNLVSDESTLKHLDSKNIGRENYRKADYVHLKITGIAAADKLLEQIYLQNPLRAHIAANYLIEMRNALQESVRVLKKGGHLVLVVGNNQVCGLEFETQEYLREILESFGLKVILRLIDDIQSYGLMTKRNKTANIITREWVLVFKK